MFTSCVYNVQPSCTNYLSSLMTNFNSRLLRSVYIIACFVCSLHICVCRVSHLSSYDIYRTLLHADVSAELLLDGTRLLHLVLCSENVSELLHAVLHVRCHVPRGVSFENYQAPVIIFKFAAAACVLGCSNPNTRSNPWRARRMNDSASSNLPCV